MLNQAPNVLVVKKFTATSTDMLSGTELAKIPNPGYLLLFIASTVNTATVTLPQEKGAVADQAQDVALWANGVPPVKDIIPYYLTVDKGNAPTIVLGGTTGTVFMVCAYYRRG